MEQLGNRRDRDRDRGLKVWQNKRPPLQSTKLEGQLAVDQSEWARRAMRVLFNVVDKGQKANLREKG